MWWLIAGQGTCRKCKHATGVAFRPDVLHQHNSSAGYLDLQNCKVSSTIRRERARGGMYRRGEIRGREREIAREREIERANERERVRESERCVVIFVEPDYLS